MERQPEGRFTFFRSYYEAALLLPSEKERHEFYDALFAFAFRGEDPGSLSNSSRAVFEIVRHSVAKSVIRSAAGAKGGSASQAKTDSASQAKNESASQRQDKDEEVDKDVDKDIIAVIQHLNAVCGTNYRPDSKNARKHIAARLKEGATLAQCKRVIDIKHKEWANDPKMVRYLRPQTLFNSEKFEGYLNEPKTSPDRQYASTEERQLPPGVNPFKEGATW